MTPRVSVGLVPVRNDPQLAQALETVCAALSDALGVHCDLRVLPSPEKLEAAFAQGAIDLLWCSPTLALRSPALRTAVPLVSSVREGVALYHGVLITLRSSPIAGPLDLRGTRAAWVSPTSASGYLYARVTLAGHGIDPDGLFGEERFVGTHGAVVQAVLDGDAHVGATFAVFDGGDASKSLVRAGYHEAGRGDEFQIVLATPPIPAELWLARAELDETLGHTRIIEALEGLASSCPDALQRAFGAQAFAATRAGDLDELRRQLADAEALGVLT